ncbi:hypothetical protein B0H13DRAFT_1914536 [Mycena leptocephala]|nr:hypothetical protein B0H13DRAFT_1914536 [Mycena leptocephala]
MHQIIAGNRDLATRGHWHVDQPQLSTLRDLDLCPNLDLTFSSTFFIFGRAPRWFYMRRSLWPTSLWKRLPHFDFLGMSVLGFEEKDFGWIHVGSLLIRRHVLPRNGRRNDAPDSHFINIPCLHVGLSTTLLRRGHHRSPSPRCQHGWGTQSSRWKDACTTTGRHRLRPSRILPPLLSTKNKKRKSFCYRLPATTRSEIVSTSPHPLGGISLEHPKAHPGGSEERLCRNAKEKDNESAETKRGCIRIRQHGACPAYALALSFLWLRLHEPQRPQYNAGFVLRQRALSVGAALAVLLPSESSRSSPPILAETEEKERMPLVIILDEARRLLYPIQFFLILEIQTSRYLHLCVHPSIPAYRAAPTPRTDAHALAASGRCGLRTQHRNRGESTGTGAQTRPDWGARLQRATANLSEREVGDVLRTRDTARRQDVSQRVKGRCAYIHAPSFVGREAMRLAGGRCETRSPESGQDASQRAKEENGEGVPKRVQSEFVDSGGGDGNLFQNARHGRGCGMSGLQAGEIVEAGVHQTPALRVPSAVGASGRNAGGWRLRPERTRWESEGAPGAGNVEGEEAASLSRLPSEFQRARAATVRRLCPECARPGCGGRSGCGERRGLGGGILQMPSEVQEAHLAQRWSQRRPMTDVIGTPTFWILVAQQAGRHRGGGRVVSNVCGRASWGPAAVGMIDGGGKRIESGVVTSRHGRFFSIRDSRSSSRSLHFDQTSMPKIQQEPGRMERQRRRELAAITRIRDPIEQCLAHVATPRHKDHGGELYTLFRVVGVDKLEVKSRYSIDTVRRQFEYRDNCVGVEFIWCYKYTCDNVKLLERLVHLTLRARGAAIVPYECPGCGVKHREFYLDSAAGGIDGVCEIVEFWLGALGQPINKTVIEPIE